MIDLEGEIVSRDRIEGVAVVQHSLRSLSWESCLRGFGIDVEKCPTPLDMTLLFAD